MAHSSSASGVLVRFSLPNSLQNKSSNGKYYSKIVMFSRHFSSGLSWLSDYAPDHSGCGSEGEIIPGNSFITTIPVQHTHIYLFLICMQTYKQILTTAIIIM